MFSVANRFSTENVSQHKTRFLLPPTMYHLPRVCVAQGPRLLMNMTLVLKLHSGDQELMFGLGWGVKWERRGSPADRQINTQHQDDAYLLLGWGNASSSKMKHTHSLTQHARAHSHSNTHSYTRHCCWSLRMKDTHSHGCWSSRLKVYFEPQSCDEVVCSTDKRSTKIPLLLDYVKDFLGVTIQCPGDSMFPSQSCLQCKCILSTGRCRFEHCSSH